MKELINIAGQKFYYSTVEQLIDRCSKKERCAIIIDQSHLNEFLLNGRDTVGECVNQMIIISDNVDTALVELEGKEVLLISANSFEKAVQLAILGKSLSNEIVCIPKENEEKVGEILDLIMTK